MTGETAGPCWSTAVTIAGSRRPAGRRCSPAGSLAIVPLFLGGRPVGSLNLQPTQTRSGSGRNWKPFLRLTMVSLCLANVEVTSGCAAWPRRTRSPGWSTAGSWKPCWRRSSCPLQRASSPCPWPSSTWTTSRASTTPSVTTRATNSSSASPPGSRRGRPARRLVACFAGDEFVCAAPGLYADEARRIMDELELVCEREGLPVGDGRIPMRFTYAQSGLGGDKGFKDACACCAAGRPAPVPVQEAAKRKLELGRQPPAVAPTRDRAPARRIALRRPGRGLLAPPGPSPRQGLRLPTSIGGSRGAKPDLEEPGYSPDRPSSQASSPYMGRACSGCTVVRHSRDSSSRSRRPSPSRDRPGGDAIRRLAVIGNRAASASHRSRPHRQDSRPRPRARSRLTPRAWLFRAPRSAPRWTGRPGDRPGLPESRMKGSALFLRRIEAVQGPVAAVHVQLLPRCWVLPMPALMPC